jgi:serine/threonine protein kinase
MIDDDDVDAAAADDDDHDDEDDDGDDGNDNDDDFNFVQILSAIKFLSENFIAHRDLTTSNIISLWVKDPVTGVKSLKVKIANLGHVHECVTQRTTDGQAATEQRKWERPMQLCSCVNLRVKLLVYRAHGTMCCHS